MARISCYWLLLRRAFLLPLDWLIDQIRISSNTREYRVQIGQPQRTGIAQGKNLLSKSSPRVMWPRARKEDFDAEPDSRVGSKTVASETSNPFALSGQEWWQTYGLPKDDEITVPRYGTIAGERWETGRQPVSHWQNPPTESRLER
jgi:hypothetical protein